jgi:hypothetical protein
MSKATVENISTIKTLFEGFEVSEETVEKLSELLAVHLAAAKEKILDEALSEKIKLQRLLEEKNDEIENLIEKGDKYGEYLQEQFEIEKTELLESQENHRSELSDEFADNLEKYSQYVVEQFVESSKNQLLENRNFKRMQNAFIAIKETLQEHMIEIDPTDEYIKLSEEVDLRTTKYNELMESYSKLSEKVKKTEYNSILENKISDLADTQKEKVRSLIESIETKDKEEFARAVNLIILEVKSENKEAENMLTESVSQKKTTTMVDNSKKTNYEMTDFNSSNIAQRNAPNFEERMSRYLELM